MTSSTGASSVAVLDACRALHAAVHDPPRFVQTLPVFSASLFGLDGKAWLDDPAEDAARDAVASVVGAGADLVPYSLCFRAVSSSIWVCALRSAGGRCTQCAIAALATWNDTLCSSLSMSLMLAL